MSSVTPDHHSEDDDTVAAAKRRLVDTEMVEGPTIRTKDGSLATKPTVQLDSTPSPPGELAQQAPAAGKAQSKNTGIGMQPTQGPYAPTTWSGAATVKQRPSISPPKSVGRAIFARPLEDKYRVATYHGIPVYGAVKSADGQSFSYLEDTELHLVWDIDQSKLVGEGTNDVELVIKCVLWWKEEMSHDPNFVPSSVPDNIRKEFQTYCDGFDVEKALESVMHLLVRPGAKEFVDKHPNAKWWTFTNKDREVDGQVVRDVSDDDGQVLSRSAPAPVPGLACCALTEELCPAPSAVLTSPGSGHGLASLIARCVLGRWACTRRIRMRFRASPWWTRTSTRCRCWTARHASTWAFRIRSARSLAFAASARTWGEVFLSLFSPVFFLSPRLTLRWMGVWKGVWKGVCAHLHGWWMHCVAYSMHPFECFICSAPAARSPHDLISLVVSLSWGCFLMQWRS